MSHQTDEVVCSVVLTSGKRLSFNITRNMMFSIYDEMNNDDKTFAVVYKADGNMTSIRKSLIDRLFVNEKTEYE